MAYNYLGLVNDINRRLNEVELTSSNFTETKGYYSLAKDSINSSIRHINQEEFEWPFNHREEEEVLVAGEVRYSLPHDCKTVSMNSFRIKRDDSLSIVTSKLKVLNYEEYLDKYIDLEYNSSASVRETPKFVARSPSNELIFVPSADKAYEVVYEYYSKGFDLTLPTDVPTLPEEYRHVIVEGSMYYVYLFQGDVSGAQLSLQKFEQGIKNLRSIFINRTEYLKDTRVHY